MSYRCLDCRQRTAPLPDSRCWWCAGELRLNADQRAYLLAVKQLRLTSYPHCDNNVLHWTADCRYCALPTYQQLHELRHRFGIAYSGDPARPGQSPCPSQAWRPAELIERWPGNRATSR